MYNKKCTIIFAFTILYIGVLCFQNAVAGDKDLQDRNPVSEYKDLYQILGISEDASDGDIVGLLRVIDKRIVAIALIEYKKIDAAIPHLLDIVKDPNTNSSECLTAANALCTMGNKEWVLTIKTLSTDPNGMISRTSYKYDAAGLLARAGDYSQFSVVEKGLSDKKDFIRSAAIHELGKFAHPEEAVTDKAADLLLNTAKNESRIKLREWAIESLERLAKVKPSLQKKVIESLEANVNSTDNYLRTTCTIKLKAYKKSAGPNGIGNPESKR